MDGEDCFDLVPTNRQMMRKKRRTKRRRTNQKSFLGEALEEQQSWPAGPGWGRWETWRSKTEICNTTSGWRARVMCSWFGKSATVVSILVALLVAGGGFSGLVPVDSVFCRMWYSILCVLCFNRGRAGQTVSSLTCSSKFSNVGLS